MSKTQEIPRNKNRILFSFQLNVLNFSESKGSSATNKYDNRTDITIKNTVLRNNDCIGKILIPTRVDCWIKIKGKEAINKAFAGVGNPINTSVCLSSLLNLARRNAENKGIKKAMYGTSVMIPVFIEIPIE